MAVFQVTPNARADVRPVLPYDRTLRLHQTSFTLPTHKKRPAVNDIFELFRLPPRCDLYDARIISSALVSGTYNLRLIEGEFNSDDDRDQDVDYGIAVNGAAGVEQNANGLWMTARKSANADKSQALALVCTAAAGADETAKLSLAFMYYINHEEN